MENSLNINKHNEKSEGSLLNKIISVTNAKIALTSLLISMGAFHASSQTNIQQPNSIEKIQLNNHPQAKTDIEALMKKHNLTTLDDLVDKDPEEIFKIRDELIILLGKNGESAYHLDTNVVKMRDALRMYMDGYADASFDRSIYKTVVGRGEKLAKTDEKLAKTDEKLAKTDEKLAKTDEKLAKSKDELAKSKDELEEIKKVAKQYGIKTDK